MFFPLRDSNPSGTTPFVTMGIIVLNSLMWLYETSLGPHLQAFVMTYGLTPARVMASAHLEGGVLGNAVIPMFSSIFMHGGWMHIIGNMWFLWIFGDNIEDRLGHGRFLIFYLLCGVLASLAHVFLNPASRAPLIGASGAISGVLGAYLIAFPHARVHTLLFIRYVEVPAWVFLIVWIGFQLVSGAAVLGKADVGGVAFWAHIGGFGIGALVFLILPARRNFRDMSKQARGWRRRVDRW